MNQKQVSIQSIIFVALFSALTFIGTSIKIPMPTGAFAHLGNAILLLAVLLIGYKRGALAGGIGFALFDVMNGYATEAPYFILESFVVGGAAYLVYNLFHKNLNGAWKLIVVGLSAGVVKIIMTQLKNTVVNLIAGADFSVAFTGALVKLPATMLNVVTTIVLISIVYYPLQRSMQTIFYRK